ncbi:GGDEF domain-containing protein [Roseateles violae]|uniref:Diguanylate cyclase DosC n=1 Tax=Roseateles violae TaxID=3058042 RepID=A0ABT8DPI5_9BURK|nr:GGDEF domain-containing protein [Pelomonas sp. PFR6]MDN3920262.1 GGDEF domain-containing protein [Pelomonas sp. PFR6]
MNPTRKSLLEQMQLHELEIQRRKELLDFTARDAQLLRACRDFIEDEVDETVATFYAHQTGVEEISLIIGDVDTLTRLRQAMTQYVRDLFSGEYGAAYVNNRLRIGLVHKRIGVAPKYYLSAMRVLKSLLMDVIDKRLGEDAACGETKRALDKLLYLDNEFVFDTYIRSLLAELESARDRAELHALKLEEKVAERTRELEELARKDPLTGLFNQRHFTEALTREFARARRKAEPLALLYIDLDDFKSINDRDGHLVGDEVLKRVATLISSQCRSYDVGCRSGGDEFCILLPGTSGAGARELAQRMLDQLAAGGDPTALSIGIAVAGPVHWPATAAALIDAADQAMYAAKGHGGSRLQMHAGFAPGGGGERLAAVA